MLEEFTVNALPLIPHLYVVLLSWLFLGTGVLIWILLLSMSQGKENILYSCIQLQQRVQRINFWDQHAISLSNIESIFIVTYSQYT